MTTESVALGDILSVTTGYLVSRDHMDGVYRVCDFMSGSPNFTHRLPATAEKVTPAIFAQHPFLEDIEVPEDRMTDEESVLAWLAEQEALYGTHLDLTPMEGFVRTNPLTDLAEMLEDRP